MTQPILTDIPMESFLSHIDAVAGAIARSDWRPDYIVGVGRGGLVPATYLSHAISQPMLSVDLSAQVVGFCDELLDKLVAMALEGSRLLFVDDINDSGRTINQLRAALAGAPADHLRFAVLIDNVSSAAKVEYRATTIDRVVTKDWFVFPWEAVASRASILSDWGEVPERTS